MRVLKSSMLVVASVVIGGCTPEGRGFKLPDGEIESGRAVFVDLACNDCHSVAGIERAADSETELNIGLGGPTNSVKTYGQLVTSIINPSHVINRPYPRQRVEEDGESTMRAYNQFMTVQQLVDLVTFLESEYELRVPPSYL